MVDDDPAEAGKPDAAITQPGILWLIGLSGAGKSTVGRHLANLLGRRLFDIDKMIETEAGCTVRELFAREGEAAFRQSEIQLVRRLATSERFAVVATGGGTSCGQEALAPMKASGLLIWLRADIDEVMTRVDVGKRPLLAEASDPRAKLVELGETRRHWYGRADLAIDRGSRDSLAVAEEIVAWLESYGPAPLASPPATEISVDLGQRTYPILIDEGAAPERRFAAHLARRASPGRTTLGLVTDENVFRLHGRRYLAALQQRGFRVHLSVIPPGEESKTLATIGTLAESLVAGGLDRQSTLIGLGGGVVGDVTGFVASILYRGIAVAQVPTTLLAQVDASVGGKTGANLALGKNLVGTFHQPLLVFADITALRTLEPRDLASGLAEVVKHALLEGGTLWAALEQDTEAASQGDAAVLARLVATSCAWKARVVEQDEREVAARGGRALLNLGHTVGHALEAGSLLGLEPLRHGEAVALGLLAASRVSRALGGDATMEARLTTLFARLGLPTDLDRRLDETDLEAAMVDKKRGNGLIRFVVLDRPGAARLVPLSHQRLLELLQPPAATDSSRRSDP